MKHIIIALLVASCSSSTPRSISVTGEVDIGKEAVEAWSALGFTYVEQDGDITVNVSRGDVGNLLGHTHGYDVTINQMLTGDAVRHVARHEFGHVLLQSMHLESYGTDVPWTYPGYGIMNASPYRDGVVTWILKPTTDDYALACYTIEVCVD